MALPSLVNAWPEGNWRYGEPKYDELREKYNLTVANEPVSPTLNDGWNEEKVILAVQHEPKHGIMIHLASNSTEFDCTDICQVFFRFDDEKLQDVYFFTFPIEPAMLTLIGDDAMKFFDKITSSKTLILEVKRKDKRPEQFKYRLEGFYPLAEN